MTSYNICIITLPPTWSHFINLGSQMQQLLCRFDGFDGRFYNSSFCTIVINSQINGFVKHDFI